MIVLSPKLQFQKGCPEEAKSLAEQAPSKWMASALTHALAQMSADKASQREMDGARKFIVVFLNLAEESEEPGTLPDKSGLDSFDPDPKEETKPKS